MPPTVKVSLVTFTDFACAVGPDRARITARLRRQYEDPLAQAYAYYRDFDRALVHGLRGGNLPSRLELAIDACTRTGQARHYQALSAGALELVRRARIREVVSIPPTSWTHGQLKLTVSPALGVTLADGTREAWFLHHKEITLNQKMADAPLVILRDALVANGLDLVPRVVDVREGRRWGLTRTRTRALLEGYVCEEADAFVRYWARAALAA